MQSAGLQYRSSWVPRHHCPPIPEEYKINAGDNLSIKLFYNPELNQEVVVRPDGRITLQLVNEIKVVGLTPAKLSEMLTEGYAKYLAQPPEISVIVTSFAGNRIFVGGEVGGGGGTWRGGGSIRELDGPTTVLQEIMLSGGFKDTADRNQVILVRRDENNKPIYMCLDIEKAMKGIDPNQDIYLQAYDMILVPRSGIANVDLWVRPVHRAQYRLLYPIRILLLFLLVVQRPLDRWALPIHPAVCITCV